MSEFKLTTVEEFEAATERLLETGAKVGADAWQFRVKNQTPHCKVSAVVSVLWDHVVLQKKHREEFVDVTYTVSLDVTI